MCVGASSWGDGVRGLPLPFMKDDVMALNHELRFADFWKSPNGLQLDIAVARVQGVAYMSGGFVFGIGPTADTFGGFGCGAVEGDPQGLFLVVNLQHSSAPTLGREGDNGGDGP